MFIGEYDYDLDMQVKAEEAREEGKQKKGCGRCFITHKRL